MFTNGMQRRQYIALLSTGPMVALAGCGGDGEDEEGGGDGEEGDGGGDGEGEE